MADDFNILDQPPGGSGNSNVDVEVLPSEARVSSFSGPTVINEAGKGGNLVIDVTAIVTAPSIVVTVEGKDEESNKWYTILVSAAITAVGTTVLEIFPGLVIAANETANAVLPRQFRVSVEHANANSITYSIGASLIL